MSGSIPPSPRTGTTPGRRRFLSTGDRNVNHQIILQDQLRKKIEQEMRERVAAHKVNVARLEAARSSARNFSVSLGNRPLVLLAHGDSWFDYPLSGNGPSLGDTDVIAQLRRIGAMPPTILNLSVAGNTALNEMSLSRQSILIEQLGDQSNWIDGKPDAILFSAGGNDIAGEEFCIFLDFNDGNSSGLNLDRFQKSLGMVEACYLNLFSIRDRVVPNVPIFGHCYDFPIPNGAHPICAGPWLKPSLDYCNWSVSSGIAIARQALTEFRAMLKRLEAEPTHNFHVIETQGTLNPDNWANELHPYPEGFKAIAHKFADALDTFLRPTFGEKFRSSLEGASPAAGDRSSDASSSQKRNPKLE